MDFTGLTLDTASCLAAALLVVGGYASIWAIQKVILIFRK